MGDSEPLTYLLVLDGLDGETATYRGPNGAMAQVDRAAFDSNDRPTEVSVVIGRASSETSRGDAVNLQRETP